MKADGEVFYFVLLGFVVLASGCVHNQTNPEDESQASIQEFIHNSSFDYNSNSAETMERINKSTFQASVIYNFYAEDTDETYTLNPGLFVKIFDSAGKELGSKALATQKSYNISAGEVKVNLSSENTFFSCFTTKEYNENNSWGLEDKNGSEIYCQEYKLEEPEIELEISPETVNLYFDEVTWDSTVAETEKSINITNKGDLAVLVSPAITDGRQLSEKASNGRTVLSEERGVINIGTPGEQDYEKKVSPGESVQMPVRYAAGLAYRGEGEPPGEISREAQILVNAEPAGNTSTAIKSFSFQIQLQ